MIQRPRFWPRPFLSFYTPSGMRAYMRPWFAYWVRTRWEIPLSDERCYEEADKLLETWPLRVMTRKRP